MIVATGYARFEIDDASVWLRAIQFVESRAPDI
jgi:hypothetical protein